MNGENGNDKTHRLLEAILLELQDHGKYIREMRADIRALHEDVRVLKDDVRVLKEDVAQIKAEMKALARRAENLELVVVDMNRRLENVERALISFSGLFKDVQDLRERIQRLEAKVR